MVFLDVQANLPETSPFSAQIAVLSRFFQFLIVLGMFNFGLRTKLGPFCLYLKSQSSFTINTIIYTTTVVHTT